MKWLRLVDRCSRLVPIPLSEVKISMHFSNVNDSTVTVMFAGLNVISGEPSMSIAIWFHTSLSGFSMDPECYM
jgi:hypothetical protein